LACWDNESSNAMPVSGCAAGGSRRACGGERCAACRFETEGGEERRLATAQAGVSGGGAGWEPSFTLAPPAAAARASSAAAERGTSPPAAAAAAAVARRGRGRGGGAVGGLKTTAGGIGSAGSSAFPRDAVRLLIRPPSRRSSAAVRMAGKAKEESAGKPKESGSPAAAGGGGGAGCSAANGVAGRGVGASLAPARCTTGVSSATPNMRVASPGVARGPSVLLRTICAHGVSGCSFVRLLCSFSSRIIGSKGSGAQHTAQHTQRGRSKFKDE